MRISSAPPTELYVPGVSRAKLELELIQSHMAQKPVLRGEVGCACVTREVSVERGANMRTMFVKLSEQETEP